MFAEVIPGAEWLTDLPTNRRDVDDPPGALRTHRRQDELGQAGQAEDANAGFCFAFTSMVHG
jgi:hypothetical protein